MLKQGDEIMIRFRPIGRDLEIARTQLSVRPLFAAIRCGNASVQKCTNQVSRTP
jgi:hypothetical protein